MDALAGAHELLVHCLGEREGRHGEDPGDPSTVQAMQMALHLPKEDAPSRAEVLRDAAAAVVTLCLDPRAGEEGPWREALERWYTHRIRKVARRARNKAWVDVQALPGVTVGAARAFVPSAVRDVPHAIRKLQVRGTDLPADGRAPLVDDSLPTLHVNAGLGMSAGKAAAQVGHASMLLAAALPLDVVRSWGGAGYGVNVVEAPATEVERLATLDGTVAVRDAGFTEVAPDSLTVVGVPARGGRA